jgi:hypothetical protein
MNISVHIERLVLDGLFVSHGQRPLLQAAVEAELTRLLTAATASICLAAFQRHCTACSYSFRS